MAISLRKLSLILCLFFIYSCEKEKEKHIILLIDYTFYDSNDIQNELIKFKDDLKEKSEGSYEKYEEIKNTKISYMAVNDEGANPVKYCTRIPLKRGMRKEKIRRALNKLDECFYKIIKQIKELQKKYYKTLYVEAIDRALDELKHKNNTGGIYIFGDLAIVDNECFLEEPHCKCTKHGKWNRIVDTVNSYKKKHPDFLVRAYRIKITKEQNNCRNKRLDIWKEILN